MRAGGRSIVVARSETVEHIENLPVNLETPTGVSLDVGEGSIDAVETTLKLLGSGGGPSRCGLRGEKGSDQSDAVHEHGDQDPDANRRERRPVNDDRGA